eukprot:5153874-Pleurochrysis_carterae.AAC.3
MPRARPSASCNQSILKKAHTFAIARDAGQMFLVIPSKSQHELQRLALWKLELSTKSVKLEDLPAIEPALIQASHEDSLYVAAAGCCTRFHTCDEAVNQHIFTKMLDGCNRAVAFHATELVQAMPHHCVNYVATYRTGKMLDRHLRYDSQRPGDSYSATPQTSASVLRRIQPLGVLQLTFQERAEWTHEGGEEDQMRCSLLRALEVRVSVC